MNISSLTLLVSIFFTNSMDGGSLVVETLCDCGTKMIFGLPGNHNLPIYSALFNRKDVRLIDTLHEGNAAVMADTYGRLIGEPGICLTTSGPGATNALTGIAQAYTAASPLLHITSTVAIGTPAESLHGTDKANFLSDIYSNVTKWSTTLNRGEDIPPIISKGYHLSKLGRSGPVHISIPTNILWADWPSPLPLEQMPMPVKPDKKNLELFCNTIQKFSRTVIYLGKNILRSFSTKEAQEVAEILGSPVIVPIFYVDVFPNNHKLYTGPLSPNFWNPAAQFALDSADLLLALGVRLGSAEAGLIESFKGSVLHLDVEPGLKKPGQNVQMSVVGNLKQSLQYIVEALKNIQDKRSNSDWISTLIHIKENWRRERDLKVEEGRTSKPIHPGVLVKELNKALPEDIIVATDVGGSSFWLRDLFVPKKPNSFIQAGYYESMGHAFPTAVAAKLVNPERPVIAVTGDGSFQMCYSDFPTALKYGANIIILIMNDSCYGSIWQFQRRDCGGRYIGNKLYPMNFTRLAEIFGGKGIKVEDPKEIPNKLDEALRSQVPTVVDVITDYKIPYLTEIRG